MLILTLKKVQIVKITLLRFSQHNKKIDPAKFSIVTTGGIPLPLNAISNTLNCPFAPKKDFLGKTG